MRLCSLLKNSILGGAANGFWVAQRFSVAITRSPFHNAALAAEVHASGLQTIYET
jgi:hypothetical protein